MTTAQFAPVFENCSRHLRYLKAARERLPAPVTATHISEQADALVAALDQFAFRFVRLQDTMGAKLFRAFLDVPQRLRDSAAERGIGAR